MRTIPDMVPWIEGRIGEGQASVLRGTAPAKTVVRRYRESNGDCPRIRRNDKIAAGAAPDPDPLAKGDRAEEQLQKAVSFLERVA